MEVWGRRRKNLEAFQLMKLISHNKPLLNNEELKAFEKVVKSGWIIEGDEVRKFENNLSKRICFKYAKAVSSGTAALHLSLLALGLGEGDEVIVPSYTVGDVLNAINYTQAKPIVVDIAPNSFNLDTQSVKKKITKKTKAIIVPHMFGKAAKIDSLLKFKIPIINDSAQSLGTIYKGSPVERFGDLTVLSFFATKILATGQGGMVLTNNKKYFEFISDIINYNGRDIYKIRFNYPMTDLIASIGNSQLAKLDQFLKLRKQIGKKYQKALENSNIIFFPDSNDCDSNYFRFILKFESEQERKKAQKIFSQNFINTIIPLKDYELLHNCLKLNKKNYNNSEDIARKTLSIPLYPALKKSEIERIVKVLKNLSTLRTNPSTG